MALINNAPPPLGDPIAQPNRKEYKPGEDPQQGICSQPWGDWFTNILGNQEKAPGRIAGISLTQQNARVSDDLSERLTAGLYRIDYFFRVTAPDGTSSSIDFVFAWTDHAENLTFTTSALINDVTTEFVSDSLPLIYVDNNTIITYDSNYTSFTPGTMEFEVYVVLSEVSA